METTGQTRAMRFVHLAPQRIPGASSGVRIKPTEKRARKPVPEDQRKRVKQACEPCRRKKERCRGGIPCEKCLIGERACTKIRGNSPDEEQQIFGSRSQAMAQSIDKPSTIAATQTPMESISRRRKVFNDDDFTVKILSENRTHYSGENSLLNFSRRVRQTIMDRLDPYETEDSEDALILSENNTGDKNKEYSSTSIYSCLSCLPPQEIAMFLVQTFLRYAQSNTFLVEEKRVYHTLSAIYETPYNLKEDDIPSVCLILMVLAVGTQFAHMRSSVSFEQVNVSENILGRTIYDQVCKCIPQILNARSLESIQTCLLIAIYLMPVDNPGLAYTYFGLALNLAVQNGMHRRSKYSPGRTREVRNRIWWSLYTIHQRTSIFHGHPRTFSYVDIDTERPQNFPDLEPTNQPSNFANQVILIEVTILLEDISAEISSLRRTQNMVHFMNLLSLRQKLVDLADRLPNIPHSPSDLEIDPDVLRLDIHLHLHYWHTRLFLGRPFLLENQRTLAQTTPTEPSTSTLSGREILVRDTLSSALRIIDLDQLLKNQVGLARASYGTEFTSCRAAMLVLLACSLSDHSIKLQHALSTGLEIVKLMSIGSNGLASSQGHVIEVLERAMKRLRSSGHRNSNLGPGQIGVAETDSEYDQFKNWESLWQHGASLSSSGSGMASETRLPEQQVDVDLGDPLDTQYDQRGSSQLKGTNETSLTSGQTTDADQELDFWDMQQFPFNIDEMFGSLPLELNEFNLIPDLDFELDTGFGDVY